MNVSRLPSAASPPHRALCALRWLLAAVAALGPIASAGAEDVSAPAILQIFEARWDTIGDRRADIFQVGYGRLWVPSPARADSGNHSVGYDVFDRFDLGSPRNETLYGTQTSFKSLIGAAHAAGVLVNPELIPNHNGFSNLGTVDTRGTPDPSDDVTFLANGGNADLLLTRPGALDDCFYNGDQTRGES